MNTCFPAKEYFAHDRLRDGRRIVIRAIQPGDKSILTEVIHHLSARSVSTFDI